VSIGIVVISLLANLIQIVLLHSLVDKKPRRGLLSSGMIEVESKLSLHCVHLCWFLRRHFVVKLVWCRQLNIHT